MLSEYDFSICGIPVRLSLFLFVICFEVDVKVLAEFLRICRQEAVQRKGSALKRKQPECNSERIRNDFLLHSHGPNGKNDGMNWTVQKTGSVHLDSFSTAPVVCAAALRIRREM